MAHRRTLVRLAVLFMSIGACSLVYVWQHIQTNLIGFRIHELEVANANYRREIRRLDNEVAELAAPSRIDALARAQGMSRQSTWDIVLLPSPELSKAASTVEPNTFWTVQRYRWARLARRVHTTVGPGEALADATEAGGHGG